MNPLAEDMEFAAHCRARKFLLTGSGVVYGRQPADMTHIPEEYCGAPNPTNPNSAWGKAKRAAEFLYTYYSKKNFIVAKFTRCFSFIGSYLPLDIHYAIGNLIGDGLKGDPIVVKGDGTPDRSYLYATDLAIWLWTVLFKGESRRPYNVGSEQGITIAELAHCVAGCFEKQPDVRIYGRPNLARTPELYVPSTRR